MMNNATANGSADGKGFYMIGLVCPYRARVTVSASSPPQRICIKPGACVDFPGGSGNRTNTISKKGYSKINVPLEHLGGRGFGIYNTNSDENDYVCPLAGDDPPCGDVTLQEVVFDINLWADGETEVGEVVALINAWSKK